LRSATELAAAVRNKELSSVELVDHFADRIDRLNPHVNAVITLDLARGRAEAERLDELLIREGPVGPLHGLPITVKDTLETAGLRTTAGAAEYADHVPDRDAEAVVRVKAAGAVIIGKTNTPPFADDHQTYNALFGTTNNPWDIARTPGGSSGGSAAAVALGLASFEVGSDIANSIRSPASHCGVFGHKTTHGLVPYRGHIPPAPGTVAEPDIAVIGPLARSADDLELVLDVLVGGALSDLAPPRARSLDDYRIAAWFEENHFPTAPAVRDVLEEATEELRESGAKIDDAARPGFSMIEAREVFNALLVAATSARMTDEEKEALREQRDDPGPLGKFARNVTMTREEWIDFDKRRQRLRASWAEFFREFDGVLCPCNPLPPIHHDQPEEPGLDRKVEIEGVSYRYFDQSVWAGVGGVALLPGTAAPAGRTTDGLPVGFEIIGPHKEDRTCIDIARRISEVLGGFEPPPMAL
jgi:amidase